MLCPTEGGGGDRKIISFRGVERQIGMREEKTTVCKGCKIMLN